MRASISRRSTLSCIETRRQRQRFGLGIREQAADADRHVVEPAGRIEPRADREPEIRGRERWHRALADRQQRANAGHRAAGADAADALRHQHAIVHIQRHEVRDRAERHEVQEIA